MVTTIITFLIVFSILVVVHEYGHFYFAKRSGILVREFAIGFGPKIFSYRKNGTTYTLRILPIGGYVRMAGYGEEETEIKPGMPIGLVINSEGIVTTINTSKKTQLMEAVPMEVVSIDLEKELFVEGYLAGNEDELVRYPVFHDATIIEEDGTEVQIAPIDVQFQSASLPNRMMTNFAGPMNNFILAIIAFTILAFIQGGVLSSDNRVGEVEADGIAKKSGIVTGDRILSVAGKKTDKWADVVAAIQANPDKKIDLEIENADGGVVKVIPVTPKSNKIDKEKTVGMIGVSPYVEKSFLAKITFGFTHTWSVMVQIFVGLGSIFTKGFKVFSGPVGIYAATDQVVKLGPMYVFNFLAVLSINLGIVNLLPIPALDGGKLVLNFIEGIRGKPLDPDKEGIITMIGFGLMMLLMIFVTWNDLQKFFF
ncbi:RIP metalloprotease RseP [Carnobacterium gallinarum]|uniref:RIP metalloprotease RseP n=1 Tax=Carnobacterium gallinarum TaxID=2749 RepID=UPI00054D566E|nr:RIP metalloprotease RseP [Carnobacterium gallinarum]